MGLIFNTPPTVHSVVDTWVIEVSTNFCIISICTCNLIKWSLLSFYYTCFYKQKHKKQNTRHKKQNTRNTRIIQNILNLKLNRDKFCKLHFVTTRWVFQVLLHHTYKSFTNSTTLCCTFNLKFQIIPLSAQNSCFSCDLNTIFPLISAPSVYLILKF